MRSAAATAAALAAVLACCASHAQGATARGFTLHSNWYETGGGGATDTDLQREIDAARSLRADTVRLIIPWNLLEPASATQDLAFRARIDRVMNRLGTYGMKSLVTVFGTPCWASVSPSTCTPDEPGDVLAPAASPSVFGGAVSRIVQRWGPRISAIEVWNEPYYPPAFHGKPAQYAGLVNAAGAAVDARGWTGDLLATASPSGEWPYGSDWLERLYEAGMSRHDGLSVHPYDYDWTTEHVTFNDPRPAGSRFHFALEQVRREMRAHGEAAKGMWLTEFGASVCPVDPACVPAATQADWLAAMFADAEKRPYVRGSIAYSLRDQAPDPVDFWGDRFGVLAYDFTERAAAGVLRTAFATPPAATIATERVLTVQKAGTGTVRSTLAPLAVDCGADCTDRFDHGTPVTLEARAAEGWIFTGWTGCPQPSGATCDAVMDSDRTIRANFEQRMLDIRIVGEGKVSGYPGDLVCALLCSLPVLNDLTVLLSAEPAQGWRFGGWTGCDGVSGLVCSLLMSVNRTVTATFIRQRTLTAATTGSGVVTSPAGINCGQYCSAKVDDGTQQVLDAAPSAGWVFQGWSGCPAPNGTQCSVTVGSDMTVTARFGQRRLTVQPNAAARIVSSPAGVDCGSDCTEVLPDGAAVLLEATPSTGYRFGSWSGCDEVSGNVCSVRLNADRTISASVVRRRTLTASTTGMGIVQGAPGISCGQACSVTLDQGSTVVLSATPVPGWVFKGWTGCPSASGTTCTAVLNADAAVGAVFEQRRLVVGRTGPGTVTSTPAGISCGTSCELRLPDGAQAVLTATPDAGAEFAGWAGCDGVDRHMCAVTMGYDRTVTAVFVTTPTEDPADPPDPPDPPTGPVDPPPASTVSDPAPPDTWVGRPRLRGRGVVMFAFGSIGAAADYLCRVDRAAAVPCSAPQQLRLAPGRHTFGVAARDAVGRADPTPATRTFRIARPRR